jgi:hypothetical protein
MVGQGPVQMGINSFYPVVLGFWSCGSKLHRSSRSCVIFIVGHVQYPVLWVRANRRCQFYLLILSISRSLKTDEYIASVLL